MDDDEGGPLSPNSPGLSTDPLMAASRSLAVTQGRGLEHRLDELSNTLENTQQVAFTVMPLAHLFQITNCQFTFGSVIRVFCHRSV